ncbi:MAG: hypothetical protein MUF68_09760 [Cyclobacteriaceae bacterium]|nr:hypothetical protein [Cyclobacteriaceae bacterium]
MNKIVIGFIFIPFLFCCNSDEIQEPVLEFPEFVNGTLSYQNNQRKYILHIPESYDGKTPVPMVVFLHGGGGNAQTAQGFSNFNQVSDENGFLMLYPQAFFETADNSYAWADGRGLAPDKLGISFLTQRIAFQKNNQYAAIGTLGGTMNESLYNSGNPERAIPMVFVFGTADPLVPYDGGYVSGNTELEPVKSIDDAVAYWKENNNCLNTLQKVNLPNTNTSDNSTIEVYQFTDCTCRADVKFYKVINAGHTWPGVLLPYAHSFGGTNLDMQASIELWNFFKSYSLCDE